MKIKEGFIKRQVGERVVVVPIGEAAKNFHGMINLNETGGELWDLLKENTDEDKLLESMLEIYEIEPEQAQKSMKTFLRKLRAGPFSSFEGRTYLEAGFPLRCFQRLSLPHIATLLCRWRDNRITRGASIPVLSY